MDSDNDNDRDDGLSLTHAEANYIDVSSLCLIDCDVSLEA